MSNTTIESQLSTTTSATRAILEAALEGRDISWEDSVVLCAAKGADLHALALVADALRKKQSGDTVAYVINRNVNFTNVCVKACKFCAFSRTRRSEEGYFLPAEEVVRRALEAQTLG